MPCSEAESDRRAVVRRQNAQMSHDAQQQRLNRDVQRAKIAAIERQTGALEKVLTAVADLTERVAVIEAANKGTEAESDG